MPIIIQQDVLVAGATSKNGIFNAFAMKHHVNELRPASSDVLLAACGENDDGEVIVEEVMDEFTLDAWFEEGASRGRRSAAITDEGCAVRARGFRLL